MGHLFTGYHGTEFLLRVIFSLDIVQSTGMWMCTNGTVVLTGLMYWLWQYRFGLMFIAALLRLHIELSHERQETLERLGLAMVAAEEELKELRHDKVSLERALETTKYAEERWANRSTQGWQQVSTKQQEIEILKKEVAICEEQHTDAGNLAKAIEDKEGWRRSYDGMEKKIVDFKETLLFIRTVPEGSA